MFESLPTHFRCRGSAYIGISDWREMEKTSHTSHYSIFSRKNYCLSYFCIYLRLLYQFHFFLYRGPRCEPSHRLFAVGRAEAQVARLKISKYEYKQLNARPNLQSSYISLDRRLTVGSPSGLDAKQDRQHSCQLFMSLNLCGCKGTTFS